MESQGDLTKLSRHDDCGTLVNSNRGGHGAPAVTIIFKSPPNEAHSSDQSLVSASEDQGQK